MRERRTSRHHHVIITSSSRHHHHRRIATPAAVQAASSCISPQTRLLLLAMLFASASGSGERLSADSADARGALVWPLPQQLSADGGALRLHHDFVLVHADDAHDLTGAAARLPATLRRFSEIVERMGVRSLSTEGKFDEEVSQHAMLRALRIRMGNSSDADDVPTIDTDYSYSLRVRAGDAQLQARSVFGVMYGLETFVQLLRHHAAGGLALPHCVIDIDDAPQYKWRGVMVDAGRRFFPMHLLHNLLETMAAVKMNVLHLHASDYCRWSVQSKLYPELTVTDITGTSPGFYTQDEIKSLVAFAADRGIRVIPEFDLPGHSRSLLPLAKHGLQFCGNDLPHANQIKRGTNGQSLRVLKSLLAEMAELFPDAVFNIGADETLVEAGCPANETHLLEAELLGAVQSLGKTAMGWEQLLTLSSAPPTGNNSQQQQLFNRNATIINAYTSYTAATVAARGHYAVESHAPAFYFTHPAGWDKHWKQGKCGYGCHGPVGWEMCWYDVAVGATPELLPKILGGEVSMWSDDYVFPAECNAFPGRVPANGSVFYQRSLDDAFGRSIGGLMWPRGFVAAGAYYRFNASLNVSTPDFVQQMDDLSTRLMERGAFICPPGCDCGYCSSCGVPYSKSYQNHGANCTTIKPSGALLIDATNRPEVEN